MQNPNSTDSTNAVLASVAAYVRYQPDGDQGTYGQEPRLSDDRTTSKRLDGI